MMRRGGLLRGQQDVAVKEARGRLSIAVASDYYNHLTTSKATGQSVEPVSDPPRWLATMAMGG